MPLGPMQRAVLNTGHLDCSYPIDGAVRSSRAGGSNGAPDANLTTDKTCYR
jgi:hypothetical protein